MLEQNEAIFYISLIKN